MKDRNSKEALAEDISFINTMLAAIESPAVMSVEACLLDWQKELLNQYNEIDALEQQRKTQPIEGLEWPF